MSRRIEDFYTDEFYHIYNRGVDKRTIFEDKQDFFHFLQMVDLFNQKESLGGIKEYKFLKI